MCGLPIENTDHRMTECLTSDSLGDISWIQNAALQLYRRNMPLLHTFRYRIAQKFHGSKFSRISRHSRNYFNEIFDTCIIVFSHFLSWTARWLCFSASKEWMDSIQGLSCRILKECSLKKYPLLPYLRQIPKLLA